jgi:transcriptional regulator with PAS, ATPase and Fis domain
MRVTLGDLSRLPVERLARLLLECAVDDRGLLERLHATIQEADGTRTTVQESAGGMEIIGQSPAIRHVNELIDRFAKTDEPVLVTGESGTGKELAARAIHARSRRPSGPFVAVNCAAIPATLVASELFGYEKGAFTGANARTKGQIEHAHGGTLFLDEIGDMPLDLQGHLLRFLEDRRIVRVGGRETIDVDVRVVAATNVRLAEAIGDGRFREDLYYRLNILTLPLPPLRERRDDISLLAEHFSREAAARYDRAVSGIAPTAMTALLEHGWPGNVRELMAVIRRAVVIADGPEITPADLIGLDGLATRVRVDAAPVIARPAPGSDAERAALMTALAANGENVSLAARDLAVSRVTLYRMLRRHGIELSRGLRPPPISD